jgi:hypothetical protein
MRNSKLSSTHRRKSHGGFSKVETISSTSTLFDTDWEFFLFAPQG